MIVRQSSFLRQSISTTARSAFARPNFASLYEVMIMLAFDSLIEALSEKQAFLSG